MITTSYQVLPLIWAIEVANGQPTLGSSASYGPSAEPKDGGVKHKRNGKKNCHWKILLQPHATVTFRLNVNDKVTLVINFHALK